MSNELTKAFGEGNLIGYYKTCELVATVTGSTEQKNQIIELRDNGLLTVYDYKTHRKITTFMAPSDRVEVTMLMAGQIPDNRMLKHIDINRAEAEKRS